MVKSMYKEEDIGLVVIEDDPDGDGARVRWYGWNDEMVSEIKDRIHWKQRAYDPDAKRWTVYGEDAVDEIKAISERNLWPVEDRRWGSAFAEARV